MGLFGFGKKGEKDVIDLAERYRKQKEREKQMNSDSTTSQETSESATPFSFFDSGTSDSSFSSNTSSDRTNSDFIDLSNTGTNSDRRKRLAKRILDLTTKVEELSNQIYRLEQRIEVLERKSGPGSFGPLE